MPSTPSPAPLILEGHMQTRRRSKLWSVIALLGAMEVGALIQGHTCNEKDKTPVVRTPDAKAKEEQEAKRREALELSRKCYMDLLLDTRKQGRSVTETEVKRQAWNCENLKPKSERPVAGL